MAALFTVTYGAAAGTSPPAAAIEASSRDDSALVLGGSGTATVAGVYMTVTFNANYTPNWTGQTVPNYDIPIPKLVASVLGGKVYAAQMAVTNVTPNSIVVSAGIAPAVSQAATLAAGWGITWRMD